jgi:hypothetical protein
MRGSLSHTEDRRIDEGCGLCLSCGLRRRLAGRLARVLHSRLAAILLGRLSRRLLRMVGWILRVRRRVRARWRGLWSSRRRHVDLYVGNRVSFDVVRVQAVSARREED